MKTIAIALTILVSFGITFGEEIYTITGEVTFQKDGDIYVCICAQDEWAEFLVKGHNLSKYTCQTIKMNDKIQKARKAAFQLTDIPKGSYVMIAYQDANGNGKIDYLGSMVFPEPWGTYRPTDSFSGKEQFDKIKFEINKDIRGIKIDM